MKIGRKFEKCFPLALAFIVNLGVLFGLASEPIREASSLDERVALLRGNDGSWRIPDSVGDKSSLASRQGLKNRPLSVHDVSGERLGEVYQIRSSEKYVGLLLVANQRGRSLGLSSGFSEVQWPLDRVSHEMSLKDLNNSLFEPSFYLILDEDRLLLRVNLGKKELDLNDVYLNADEIGRGNVRVPARGLER